MANNIPLKSYRLAKLLYFGKARDEIFEDIPVTDSIPD